MQSAFVNCEEAAWRFREAVAVGAADSAPIVLCGTTDAARTKPSEARAKMLGKFFLLPLIR